MQSFPRSRETLATAQQLSEVGGSLKNEIEHVNRSLSARINGVETSLNSRMDRLETSLNARMDGLETSLNARMDGLETSLKTEIAAVNKRIDGMVTRAEFDAKFDAFRHEIDWKIEKLNAGIVRWVFMVGLGSWAVQAGTIVGLIKFLAPHTP